MIWLIVLLPARSIVSSNTESLYLINVATGQSYLSRSDSAEEVAVPRNWIGFDNTYAVSLHNHPACWNCMWLFSYSDLESYARLNVLAGVVVGTDWETGQRVICMAIRNGELWIAPQDGVEDHLANEAMDESVGNYLKTTNPAHSWSKRYHYAYYMAERDMLSTWGASLWCSKVPEQ